MRMFRKKSETENIVIYSYSYEAYPFDGEVEITKKPLSAKMIKQATGEWQSEYAIAYAKQALSEHNFPDKFTDNRT